MLSIPVKELGLHDIRVVLHPEVDATITLNVARSQDEAELQAAGKSIADVRAEEEAAEAFDVAQLFENDEDADEFAEDGEAPASEEGDDQPRG